MSQNLYANSTLDVDLNQIRLLELAPSEADNDLCASLSTASLNSSPSYEALSYVWGDRTMPKSIKLHSSSFPITKNLEAALQRMRLPSHTRTLWVDAICINQDDQPERQTQVQLMRRIYSQSTRVLIWLGEEEEGDKEVFDFLISLSGGAYAFTRDCVDRPNDEYQKGDCETPLRELTRLVNRPWWFRAWTLQEIACGKDCRLHCGSLEISWQDVFQAYDQLRVSQLLASTVENNRSLCLPCRSGITAYTQLIGAIAAHRNSIEIGRQADLLECVARHRSRHATDPRDKVYAFLGLAATFHAELVVPDYTKSVGEVYFDFAFQTLNMDGPRILLHAADSEQSHYPVPSWVPDWTAAIPTSYGDIMQVTRQLRYDLFNACGSELASALVYEDIQPGVLCFESVLVDSVLHVGETHPWKEWRVDDPTLVEWADLVQLESEPDRPYATTESAFREAFWRTILCDTVIMGQFRGSQYIRATPEHGDYFWKAWNPQNESDEDLDENSREFIPASVANIKLDGGPIWGNPSIIQVIGSIPSAVLGRRIFITRKGFIGIGPSNMREGDEVWVVARCKVPIVVRRCEDESVILTKEDKAFPLYKLVGDSYVHGAMDGEMTGNWDQEKTLLMLK